MKNGTKLKIWKKMKNWEKIKKWDKIKKMNIENWTKIFLARKFKYHEKYIFHFS